MVSPGNPLDYHEREPTDSSVKPSSSEASPDVQSLSFNQSSQHDINMPSNGDETFPEDTTKGPRYHPLPLPRTPGTPFFQGDNVTEFLEAYYDMIADYNVTEAEGVRRLPKYCAFSYAESVKGLRGWEDRRWKERTTWPNRLCHDSFLRLSVIGTAREKMWKGIAASMLTSQRNSLARARSTSGPSATGISKDCRRISGLSSSFDIVLISTRTKAMISTSSSSTLLRRGTTARRLQDFESTGDERTKFESLVKEYENKPLSKTLKTIRQLLSSIYPATRASARTGVR
jgi:hypothetical protein